MNALKSLYPNLASVTDLSARLLLLRTRVVNLIQEAEPAFPAADFARESSHEISLNVFSTFMNPMTTGGSREQGVSFLTGDSPATCRYSIAGRIGSSAKIILPVPCVKPR